MSPKTKDDREESEEALEPPPGLESGETQASPTEAAAAYGRRTITKSGKFAKTASSSKKSSSSAREETSLIGSAAQSRYTFVAPRAGKKKKPTE